MPKQTIDQLVKRRANAMARVVLSRRDDLIIAVGEKPLGVDLLVSIVKGDRPTFRQFGVIDQGHVELFETASQAAAIMNSCLRKRPAIEEVMTPVCVFLFNMTGELGYYAWMFEPLNTNQSPRLRKHDNFSCKLLDTDALEEIVGKVNEYYDALASTLIAS